MREADVLAESKDPYQVDLSRTASGNPHTAGDAGGIPCNIVGTVSRAGVLRLRGCFASRTSCCAQDDKSKQRNRTGSSNELGLSSSNYSFTYTSPFILARGVGFQIADCKALHARVRVRSEPAFLDPTKRQLAMLNRRVRQLANVPERDLLGTGTGNRKTNGVPVAVARKMRAGMGVPQVTKIVESGITRRSLLSRCTAIADPSRPQRQTRRMKP